MLLLENIKLAISAIKANKMRSFLTMLGIIIGISSVIAISSIGASAQGAVSKEFESFGGGYMYLSVNWQQTEEVTQDMLFSVDDIDALKARFPEALRYTAPYAYAKSDVKVGRTEAELSIMGVAADYNKFSTNIDILHGRMINKRDVEGARDNVVIPREAADKLFGKEDVIGETIAATIMGNPVDLTVVGVYQIPASIFTQLDTSSSYSCYMPYSAISRSDELFSYIEIFADDNKSIEEQGNAFASYMQRYKDVPENTYTYESAEQQLSQINTVLGYLSLAIGAIAAISLLVGGIGIMNIMLVSVTERTREIGIRKSLGARTNDILTQFLIEAMILAVIGGALGTAIGIGIAAIGATLVGVDIVLNISSILIAVVFSAAVGLFFGLFPARKAAKMDPIEALRYE
ncbi:MAG: ABC transporter permease [Eubacteriales bacterium]|nr:ABC transporter permease [Eubacteriales bacterium]MDD4390541.1 ABC transporter permease [Eubacteriales bacterium]